MFSDLLNAALKASNVVDLQEVILQISNEAVQNGLSFKDKMLVHHMLLDLTSKHDNVKDIISHLMKVIVKCQTIPGNDIIFHVYLSVLNVCMFL